MITSIANNYSFDKDGVTQSLMAMYVGCPRSFAIATHALSQPSKFVMELGTFGHKMIETGGKGIPKYTMGKIVTTEQREQAKAYMEAIIPAYFHRYKREDAKYRVNPEYVFDTRISGVRFRGKIDAILSSGKGGRLDLKETKFKARISENDLNQYLGMDWQSLCYVVAVLLEQKRPPKGVIYDVVRYPTIKPGMLPKDIFDTVSKGAKKDPDHWFKRWSTEFDELEIMAFHGELQQKIMEMKDRKIWYRNQCNCNKGFKCQYIDYCSTDKTDMLITKKLFSELED